MLELHKKWIEALRSGKYKQGTGQYCTKSRFGDEHRYCCLGVLAEIAGVEKKCVDGVYLWENGVDENGHTLWTIMSPDKELVQQKMKLRSHMGYPKEEPCVTAHASETVVKALWWLNDDYKWSFEKIADHLEKHIDSYAVD